MIRNRIARALAVAAAAVGVAAGGVAVAPTASADVLGDIRGAVNGARGQSTCPPLNYSIQLEGDAQQFAGNTSPGVPPPGGYVGEKRQFINRSDPGNHGAAVNQARATINDCKFKDFGVGFVRDDENEVSITTIVLGAPPAAPQEVKCEPAADFESPTVPAGQQCKPKPKPKVACPAGSPTPEADTLQLCAPVPPKDCPAGSVKPQVVAPEVCGPPTNAVTMQISGGALQRTVTVNNNGPLGGTCAYDAKATGGLFAPNLSRQINVGPNAPASIDVPAPPLGSSYHVTLKCTGTYDGKQVQFGQAEQDVSSF